MPPAEGGGMEIFMNEKKEVVLACENWQDMEHLTLYMIKQTTKH